MNKTETSTPPLAVRSNAGLGDRITELEKQHGSLRAAAKVLGCDAGYLSRLRSGEKENPSAILLKRIGLRRVIAYERIKYPNVELRGAPKARPSDRRERT